MRHAQRPRSLALALCLAALGSCFIAAKAQQSCPISPSEVELDFAPVAKSCEAATLCTSCVCSLVTVFTPALRSGNVTFDPASPASFRLEPAAGIIRSCSEQYLVSMIRAGIDVASLASLDACTFASEADVPPCLAESIAGLAANATTVTATSRTGEAEIGAEPDLSAIALPSGSPALRVATVTAGSGSSGGPVFTIQGTLSSLTQLLQVMLASDTLLAAMTPEAVSKLRAIAADPSKIEGNPATVTMLAEIRNPIDGVALLTALDQLAAGQAAAVSTTAATPEASVPAAQAAPAAPAPAATSGAAAAGAVVSSAIVGAAVLLAAALMA